MKDVIQDNPVHVKKNGENSDWCLSTITMLERRVKTPTPIHDNHCNFTKDSESLIHDVPDDVIKDGGAYASWQPSPSYKGLWNPVIHGSFHYFKRDYKREIHDNLSPCHKYYLSPIHDNLHYITKYNEEGNSWQISLCHKYYMSRIHDNLHYIIEDREEGNSCQQSPRQNGRWRHRPLTWPSALNPNTAG